MKWDFGNILHLSRFFFFRIRWKIYPWNVWKRERKKKRYSIRSLVGSATICEKSVCENWSVCYNEKEHTTYRFRHDSCKKKKEGKTRRLFEEMESGPSFRTLVSIGGRGVQVRSWAACSWLDNDYRAAIERLYKSPRSVFSQLFLENNIIDMARWKCAKRRPETVPGIRMPRKSTCCRLEQWRWETERKKKRIRERERERNVLVALAIRIEECR